VTGGEPARRFEGARRAGARLIGAVRSGGLIVLSVAAFVYGAFQIGEIVGWGVLGGGLLLLDWCRRPAKPPPDGSGPP
jgi:hypothetical protein